MASQAGGASVFVLKAADALQAALALEGGEHGDDELAAADQRYQDAIRELSCAAAFETRGAAFTAAQRGSIAVLKSRRVQLERRLGGGSVPARDTPQRGEQLPPALVPQLPSPQDSKRLSSDTSLDAPILGHENILSLLREAIILPQLLPQVFNGLRTPLRTLLLHGPPGTVNGLCHRHAIAASFLQSTCG